jgi:hypothetical protein
MISWSIVNESSLSLSVEILQRQAWRYTYYTPLCTGSTIPNGQPVWGNTAGYNIVCVSNCPKGLSTLGSVAVPCTGFNIWEQYATGEGRFTISVPQNSSFVEAFTNSVWFALATGNNLQCIVAVQIQTFKRSDNWQYNNALIITMLPIYRLRNQISYSIRINLADNDFDPYSVPGGTIDYYECYLNFIPQVIGFYDGAVTAEDFIILSINISSTAYLSRLQLYISLCYWTHLYRWSCVWYLLLYSSRCYLYYTYSFPSAMCEYHCGQHNQC